jgi:hypothetical protein
LKSINPGHPPFLQNQKSKFAASRRFLYEIVYLPHRLPSKMPCMAVTERLNEDRGLNEVAF